MHISHSLMPKPSPHNLRRAEMNPFFFSSGAVLWSGHKTTSVHELVSQASGSGLARETIHEQQLTTIHRLG